MIEPQKKLTIQTPCHMKWQQLEGNGPRRWCDQCSLNVVDGSSMTADAAKDLVEKSEERVCMRVVKDAQGRVVHTDSPSESSAVTRLLRVGLTAAAGVLAACADEPDEGAAGGNAATGEGTVQPLISDPAGIEEPARPPELLGAVCYREEMGDMVFVPEPEDGGVSGEPTEETPKDEASSDALPIIDEPHRELMGKVRVDNEHQSPPSNAPDGQ